MKLKNIVVATEKKGYYNVMEQSCQRNNVKLITLGLGKKWTGFTMRFKLWYEYLDKLDDDEIVMMNDAYDVIILENSDKIINKFKSFNKNIVFSFQDSIIVRLVFPKCNVFKKVICIGNFIGYVKYLKKMIKILFKYQYLWKKYENDDQMVLQNICNLQNNFFKQNTDIDIHQKLFFVTPGSDYLYNMVFKSIPKLYMKNNKLYNDKNETPSVLHLAGDLDGNKYLKYLNYKNIPDNNSFTISKYKTKQLSAFTKLLFYNNINIIIFSSISIIVYLFLFKINIINLLIFISGYFLVFREKGLVIFTLLILILSVILSKITSLVKL